MFVTVIALKYALLVSQWSYGHLLKLIQFYLNNTVNLRHITQRIMSCYTHKMAILSWPYSLWRHFILYIGWINVTESMVTIDRHVVGVTWQCVELKGEDLWSYSHKIESVSLRKCPYWPRVSILTMSGRSWQLCDRSDIVSMLTLCQYNH